MEIRPPKETDQEEIEKAFNIVKKCMQDHSEIEPTLWAGALWSALVDGYIASGTSYNRFCYEWENIKHHYKKWFES
jgi:hypothetical protein